VPALYNCFQVVCSASNTRRAGPGNFIKIAGAGRKLYEGFIDLAVNDREK
jgi:hypothetical protein